MIENSISSALHYIKDNFIICIAGLYAMAMVVPPLSFFNVQFYYIMLVFLFIYMVTRKNIVLNKYLVFFYFAAALSIIIGNPPVVFRSWERLGLLILVTGAVSSLFHSTEGAVFRFKLLQATLWLFVGVGIISFVCYVLGINYMQMWVKGAESIKMAGAFGGITQHSMILGPLSAFGAIFLFGKLTFERFQQPLKYILWGGMALCCLSTILSASRGALLCNVMGILIVVYLKYKDSTRNFLKTIILVAIALILCYPLYEDYAQGVMAKQQANEQNGGTFASRDEKWTNRIDEFKNSPFFGIGFASISLNTSEGASASTQQNGVVEPGSTWLAILSMTGILGAIPIYILVLGTLLRLLRIIRTYYDFNSIILFALLTAAILHQFFEGYALAGGSYLCFFFWLLFGASFAYVTEFDEEKDSNIDSDL